MKMRPLRWIGFAGMVGISGALAWRLASRRKALPCPSTLAPILEGQIADQLLGTTLTLDRMGLRPGQRILEIGPGPGRLLIPAAKRILPHGEAVGLDIQPKMLERLRIRAAKAHATNITTIEADAIATGLEPNSFDLVYLSTVLGEIPNRELALEECLRILKPGGTLSITEYFVDPHYQPQMIIRRMAEAAGFQFKAVHGAFYLYTMNFVKP